MNIFLTQNEFIDTDPRIDRPSSLVYSIDIETTFIRHQVLLPSSILKNKTVLDLGSCNAASGAWCLSNGAKHYTGVEFQKNYVTQSARNLEKYYPKTKWAIESDSIQSFIKKNEKRYDIVIALGVVHAFDDVVDFLYQISSLADCIVIDGSHPSTMLQSDMFSEEERKQLITLEKYTDYIENVPFIGMQNIGMSLHNKQTVVYKGLVPSMGAICTLLEGKGFLSTIGVNEDLKLKLPDTYSINRRFGLRFNKSSTLGKSFGFPKKSSDIVKLFKWS